MSFWDYISRMGCTGALLVALLVMAACTIVVAALPPYGAPS